MKIKNKTSIAILMATYNGERYLKEQIDSIVNQTFQDWILYIQDDGSTDGTTQIIKEYQSDKIVLVDNGLTRQGACLNFMSLLNVVESQYYMFSDQDDFWLPKKIELSIEKIMVEEQMHGNAPIIIHTDRSYTHANLKIFRESEFNLYRINQTELKRKLDSMKNPNIIAIYNIVGGCTMLFNDAVKKISFPFINVRMHDSTLAMRVSETENGVISTIYESTILYRQHGNNTCGVQDDTIMPKLMRLFNSYKRNMQGYYLWKIYGKGGFCRFLFYRVKYFLIMRNLI